MTTSARGAYAIGSTTYAGVRLARISHLSYATYQMCIRDSVYSVQIRSSA